MCTNKFKLLVTLLFTIGISNSPGVNAQHISFFHANKSVSRSVSVGSIHRGGTWVSYKGPSYITAAGVYCRPHVSSTVIVTPPSGLYVTVLPTGFSTVYVSDICYYSCGGVYYQAKDEGYVVVEAPVGALVPSIPKEAREIIIDGKTYYEFEGVQYLAVVHEDTVWYKVIRTKKLK